MLPIPPKRHILKKMLSFTASPSSCVNLNLLAFFIICSLLGQVVHTANNILSKKVNGRYLCIEKQDMSPTFWKGYFPQHHSTQSFQLLIHQSLPHLHCHFHLDHLMQYFCVPNKLPEHHRTSFTVGGF